MIYSLTVVSRLALSSLIAVWSVLAQAQWSEGVTLFGQVQKVATYTAKDLGRCPARS